VEILGCCDPADGWAKGARLVENMEADSAQDYQIFTGREYGIQGAIEMSDEQKTGATERKGGEGLRACETCRYIDNWVAAVVHFVA